MKKFLLSLLGCAALSGVCGDFFALPADKGKDLPADKVYPKGRIFPIMTYSGRNPAQYKKDGFTVIGPIYGKVDRDKVYSNTELPIIYSIRATQDGKVADKDFIRRSGIKMDYKKLAQSVREDVKEAIKKYPHIAYFYLTPEELRWWKKNEYDFIKVVTDAAHEADPEKRPVWMYLPGHYGQNSIAKYSDRMDVIGKGCYTNYASRKNQRAWVRYSVDIMKNAAAQGNEADMVLAVLEMFRKVDNAELHRIPDWARHDFYAALITGAKGLAIFSLSNRKGFTASYKLYYPTYSKAAKEITGENGLGEIFLFGEHRNDLKWTVTSGDAATPLTFRGDPKKNRPDRVVQYPAVGFANIAHARGRYLFMVNSSEKPLAGVITGAPENTVVKDAVTGEKITVAGKDGIKLEFKPLEVKLLKLERN